MIARVPGGFHRTDCTRSRISQDGLHEKQVDANGLAWGAPGRGYGGLTREMCMVNDE